MRRRSVRAPSASPAPLTHCYADPQCPCATCVARDVAALRAAPRRALADAANAALTLKYGPAVSAEALGFAPLDSEGPIELPTLAALTRKAGAL